MSAPAATRRSLAPLAIVTAAAFLFVLLLLLARLHWVPLESADHGAATRLNSLVAGHSVVVSIVKAATWLGITTFAFELSRQVTGKPVTDPVTEGLSPRLAPTSSRPNRRQPCIMTALARTAVSPPE